MVSKTFCDVCKNEIHYSSDTPVLRSGNPPEERISISATSGYDFRCDICLRCLYEESRKEIEHRLEKEAE